MAVRLLITACLLFVFFRGVSATYHFGYDVLYQQSTKAAPGWDIDVRIPEGQSIEETTKRLGELGPVRDTRAFQMRSLFLRGRVRAGEYRLNTSETTDEMLELLSTAPEKRRSGKS